MPSEKEFCGTAAKAEYSYDAWGRLRDPATQTAYTPGSEPVLFLDRGYTGHEYLPWFGLVNMNARLYDPALGRFLAPDPYVQNPLFSQNYNRYTYAMNNPLVYIDQDGEFPWLIVAVVAAFSYLTAAYSNTPEEDRGNPLKWNWNPFKWNWKDATYTISVGNNTGPSGGIGASAGIGWNDQYTTNIGYNQKSGVGIGIGGNGSTKMYYPGYDYNKPEKAAMEAIRQVQQQYQWQKEIDPSLTITGVSTTVLSEIYYSKTYGTWMGKNNKIYKQTWGGNGATGGKINYGKRMSNYFRYLGYGIGAYSAADINQERINGDIGWAEWSIEQTSNLFSTLGGTIGAAWSIGWEMGRQITNSDKYQEWKFNLYYDMWERRYGTPSSSNEWMWNYFYKNYKP